MKKQYLFHCMLLIFLSAGLMKAYAQPDKEKTQPDPTEINNLRLAIEQKPDDLDLHEQYLKATGFSKWNAPDNPDFVKQYEEWMIKFPKSPAIPYALGHAFASKESPKAKPYLLKAVEIDPKFDKAWYDLWIDGERWGDFKLSRSYLARAREAAPTNADYAFYYASGFSDSDPGKYKKLSLEVARDYPNTERGAQALYWLANRIADPAEKAMYYEQQKKEFPPDKFGWSSSGMSEYFDLLLETDPGKALALAQSMKELMTKENEIKTWTNQVTVAQNIIQAHSLLSAGKPQQASDILAKTNVGRYSKAKTAVLFLKAEAAASAGNANTAYDSLIVSYAKEPTDRINEALIKYGSQLGKNSTDINADILKARDANAKVATAFTFDQYLKNGKASLSDYRGKVVLLTYWFPGCGPCRGEFPHFQDVVNKFKGKDLVYIGLNIAPEQDEYVVPFMKSSGYSFIPLRVDPKWEKGNLDNRNAAPVNFLIDKEGRIVFSNFRISEANERTLELMIGSLLNGKVL
jgi:thiol-disulfide isomerase/thioredoxin